MNFENSYGIIIESRFGDASGVVESCIGKRVETFVTDTDSTFSIIAHIMSCLAQGQDFTVKFYANNNSREELN